MKKSLVGLMLLAPLTLAGCVIAVGGDGETVSWHSDWESREQANRQNLERLELGMGLNQARSKMGTADFDEKVAKEDKTYQLLYYRTQRLHGDGITTKNECTPLVFENGKLIGWGSTAVDLI